MILLNIRIIIWYIHVVTFSEYITIWERERERERERLKSLSHLMPDFVISEFMRYLCDINLERKV